MENKHDIMFPKSDNSRKDIVEFVKEVEKYPCLYDKTLPEYANKMHNRRAWSAIARKSNTSVPECRDRWRKIRISFMRSLKQQASTKPPMRPYYLTDELHFLHPFLSIRPKTYEKEKLPSDTKMEIELTSVEDNEISDDSGSVASFESDPIENVQDTNREAEMNKIAENNRISDLNRVAEMDRVAEINRAAEMDRVAEMNRVAEINRVAEMNRAAETNRVTYNDNTIPKITNVRTIENGYGRLHGSRNSYSEDIECNPRKMFLLSLLPDIEQLTEPEMRIFRRQVILSIDKIISDRSIGDHRVTKESILGN
ncbi:hypothetical protein PYW08_010639 [Mythimna loreyi]|uniref:Uncharacterized protein n=1 Tax=Mythimna loreyi TaxID=667449 RepID=A0ACC2Q6D6_9NEOP|nr:hypothetical protein PYW08_010639 [Mythimna loreyi]